MKCPYFGFIGDIYRLLHEMLFKHLPKNIPQLGTLNPYPVGTVGLGEDGIVNPQP